MRHMNPSVPSTQLFFLCRRFLCGFFRSCLLARALFSLRCGFVRLRLCFHLLGLRCLLWKIRSLEALAAKSDFSDPHSGVRLPMPAQFLVLLLALVMENQNLRTAAFFDNRADDPRVRLISDLTFFTGDRNDGEFHLTVRSGSDLLHPNHIARRHPVLLPTGADNRVHTSASIKCR